jgi:cytosine/uracil/thiamine/allantoin permease
LFEDNKVVSRNHSKSKEDNTMALKKDKKTNNDLQNTTQKTKDWVTRTPLKGEWTLSLLQIKSYNVLNYNNCSTDWSFPLK